MLLAVSSGLARHSHPTLSGEGDGLRIRPRWRLRQLALGGLRGHADLGLHIESSCHGVRTLSAAGGCRNAPSREEARRSARKADGSARLRAAGRRSPLRPPRGPVPATHRIIASWPLIERAARVDLFGGIAILSASKRNALYALMNRDGRIAMIGITRAGDRPVIMHGVLYEDNLLVSTAGSSPHATLKLLPLAHGAARARLRTPVREPWGHVLRHASHAGSRMRLSRINADLDGRPSRGAGGSRPAGRGDRVLFWNVAWQSPRPGSHAWQVGPTCAFNSPFGRHHHVALAGPRAVWDYWAPESDPNAGGLDHPLPGMGGRPSDPGAERVAGLSGRGGVLA